MDINVEYRADLHKRNAPIRIGSILLKPGDNTVTLDQLKQLEKNSYFNNCVENKIFLYDRPAEIDTPVEIKETSKSRSKAVLSSINVDDGAP